MDLNISSSKHLKLILSFNLTAHPVVTVEVVSIEKDVRTTPWAIIQKKKKVPHPLLSPNPP